MAVFQTKPSQKPHKNFYAYYRKDLTRIRYKRRKPPAVTIYRGNFAPKKFTGKEQDKETGLYYFGARYLDPKTSRWLSGDPALGDYLPVAPNNDDAKKHNQNLPGMGGVFNVVNLHVYHYAGNNPVKYVDPDGETDSFPDGSPEQDIAWMRGHGYSDKEIADHLLRNHIKIDTTVEELGNVIFNEIRSLSGENIQEARENIAHAVINGLEEFGDKKTRDKYVKPASSIVTEAAKKADNQQYNGCQEAAINAVLKHAVGNDPTGGAEHFNLRNENETGDFLGAYQTTRVGPFNNSYPRKGLQPTDNYVSTYKRR